MQFSSLVNKQALVQDALFLCQTTTAAYPLEDITRNINQHYHDVNRIIWEVADGWHYDDSNNTDMPTAYVSLVDDQQRYTIPSTAQRIRRVEVKDSNSNWSKLEPLPEREITMSLREFLETPGMPHYYHLVGNLIEFYPPPDTSYVTLASGAAVFLDRDITEFTTASTTATPGFATPFHRILSLGAALDFEKDPQQIRKMMTEKVDLLEGLKRFYGNRAVEMRHSIVPDNRRRWRQYL